MAISLFHESSWGTVPKITDADVDILALKVSGDVSLYTLNQLQAVVMAQSAYNTQWATKNYNTWFMIRPGDTFAGTAYLGVRSTNTVPGPVLNKYACAMLGGAAGHSWQAASHEYGHIVKLGHSGAYSSISGNFDTYQDDATMGYDRQRESDFTAIARYKLGWVASDQVRVLAMPLLICQPLPARYLLYQVLHCSHQRSPVLLAPRREPSSLQ